MVVFGKLTQHTVAPSLRFAADEAKLIKLEAFANIDREASGYDFRVQLTRVSAWNALELFAMFGDQSCEDVQASRSALRIRDPAHVCGQVQSFGELYDVDRIWRQQSWLAQVERVD